MLFAYHITFLQNVTFFFIVEHIFTVSQVMIYILYIDLRGYDHIVFLKKRAYSLLFFLFYDYEMRKCEGGFFV